MYLSHFGLNEPPFRITPHTEFFFSGANRGATLEALLYAITHDEGIIKVTGEVGSGKTMLCRVLVERLPKHVETIYLANPSLSRDEILHVIAADLQVESRGERVTILLRALQERLIKLYAAGRRVVVLIDEAHAMPLETLEEIRLLSNLESNRHKLLQIVLFGQPELDDHLGLPNMRQLKERITHSFKLEPLVRSDIDSYVDFRMRAAGYRGPRLFGPPAMKLIARASEGLTRRINILADKSLLAAFADGEHQITAKHARAAVRDSEFASARTRSATWWLIGAGLAAGLLVGVASHFMDRLGISLPRGGAESVSPPAATSAETPQTDRAKAVEAEPKASTPATPVSEAGAAAAQAAAPAASPVASVAAPIVSGSSGPGSSTADAIPATTVLAAQPSPAIAAAPIASAPPTGIDGPSKPPSGARPSPIPPTSGKLTQERFAATQQWLRSAPSGHYTIQLLTVSAANINVMERFLRQAEDLVDVSDMRVYSVKLNGQQHYSATYGLYSSLEDTITAMGDLPSSFKSRGPYHRSVTLMRRQNQE
jgi:type II secretory pathway predicted ATPase ExeA/septal ring-binding cell division protein DamX